MRHWQQVLTGIVTGLIIGGGTLTAQAMPVVHQDAEALYDTSLSNTRQLNDQQVHYVPVPATYAHSTDPHGSDTIQSVAGVPITFTTKYLLPDPGYQHKAWGDPQSLAVAGRYVYVIYCPTNTQNQGRIVRFDQQALAAQHATPRQLQRVYTTAADHDPAEIKLRQAIQVGPLFTTGHGQSLAYNAHDHHLYMWCDQESAPRIPLNQWGVIDRIDAQTLQPAHQIRFRLKEGSYAVPGGHVLAFDRQGRAYFWSCPAGELAYLYQGTITDQQVKFRLTKQILRHGPGTRIQSMGYNPHNNRLYLVADDSVASLPISKLAGRGRLTSADVRWTRFASHREFEGLDFSEQGLPYLLSNHQPEILTGNNFDW